MNENIKAICSTITIVAILALLGVMVYLHTDGAVVGALGVIGTIIAWLQRTPDRKDPPSGAANVIPLVAAGALLTAFLANGCSAAQRATERTVLADAQIACIIANALTSEEHVAAICGVYGPLVGPMRQLLSGAKAAAAAKPNGTAPILCADTDAGVTCHAAAP